VLGSALDLAAPDDAFEFGLAVLLRGLAEIASR